MLKFVGILFLIIGIIIIIYSFIPTMQGYTATSFITAAIGAVCIGGAIAVIRVSNEKH